jgi:hypothetical protein
MAEGLPRFSAAKNVPCCSDDCVCEWACKVSVSIGVSPAEERGLFCMKVCLSGANLCVDDLLSRGYASF